MTGRMFVVTHPEITRHEFIRSGAAELTGFNFSRRVCLHWQPVSAIQHRTDSTGQEAWHINEINHSSFVVFSK